MKTNPKLARFSWALYDLANTIFSMNIISLYFVLWLTVDKNCPEIYYSLSLGVSMIFAAILMPVIGEVSDKLKRRVPFLIAFTLGCIVFTATLGVVQSTLIALILFTLANFCYQLAGVAYNSLLAQVSTPQTLGRTSGLGVSLGYLGAILGLLLVKPFLQNGGKSAVFAPTAGLFLLFALPAFIFIKDPPYPRIPHIELKVKTIFSRVLINLREIRQQKSLYWFLISIFLCLNAVNTIIIFMGVYAKRVIGFDDAELIYFMAISTVFAMIGSYIFGHLTDWWGSKKTLNIVLRIWCLVIILTATAASSWMFWIVGPLIGICLGATWVSARTMLIDLTPKDKIGQMFGLFGLAGRFSAVLGPVVWGIITSWVFKDLGVLKYRIAVASVFMFMLAGYLVFQKVENPKQAKA